MKTTVGKALFAQPCEGVGAHELGYGKADRAWHERGVFRNERVHFAAIAGHGKGAALPAGKIS